MQQNTPPLAGKTALITGAARRVGAVVARTLHQEGMNLVLHYRNSAAEAQSLADELLDARPDSVVLAQADLADVTSLPPLVETATAAWQRLDLLLNNASMFYATEIGSITEQHWDELMGPNLKAPLFLSQAAAPQLKVNNGCIVNMVDIHANRPLPGFPVYCVAKAGLVMLTKSLARELGPEVRVNGIAPGAILWPEAETDEDAHREILDRTALKRIGDPADIASAILYLVASANYVTGQILTVDGGRTLGN